MTELRSTVLAAAAAATLALTVVLGNPRAASDDRSYLDVVASVPGLTHYYPLDDAHQARDAVGGLHGVNRGASFTADGATFDGTDAVEIGDHPDFSVATTGAVSIVIFQTVTDWKGAGASAYVHWAGKGRSGTHEWAFRHYVDGGTGEAPQRQGRTSFYHWNPSGGFGAGSYFQDAEETTERVVVATVDRTKITLWKNGVKRDTDLLSGYKIVPRNTASSVFLGTRGDGTGYLVGKLRRVAFYNRILTDAEIQRLYAERARPEATPPSTPAPTVPAFEIPPGADLATTQKKHNELVRELKARGIL